MTGLMFALTLMSPAAEAAASRAELASANHEIALSNAAFSDDVQDQRELYQLVGDWKRARRAGNIHAELAADRAIQRWLRREIAENQHELALAQQEVSRSQLELNRERRAPRSRITRDAIIDDQRDLNDDLRDLAQVEQDLARTLEINYALDAMQRRFERRRASRADQVAKTQLLNELVALSSTEVAFARAEQAEDQRELREAHWDL